MKKGHGRPGAAVDGGSGDESCGEAEEGSSSRHQSATAIHSASRQHEAERPFEPLRPTPPRTTEGDRPGRQPDHRHPHRGARVQRTRRSRVWPRWRLPVAAVRKTPRRRRGCGRCDRSPARRHSHLVPAGTRNVVLRRLKKLVIATISTKAPSCRSSYCFLAAAQISSVTAPGRSASRVAASASASAARSAASKSGFSYHAATVSSFSELTPALAALAAPASTSGG